MRCVAWGSPDVSLVSMSEEFEFGPKMRLLTDKQRSFVMAHVEFPALASAEHARMAGYSDSGEGCKVIACRMLQDRKVVEAIQEQAGKKLWAISLKASARVEQMLDSEDEGIVLKTALAVLDRVGHAPQQNININQNVTDNSGKALMERIRALAAKHGLDPQKLLTKPVIEGEFSEVKSE